MSERAARGELRGVWLDASDVAEAAGGCTICDVEWSGPYHDVQNTFIGHDHDVLAHARYVLDAWPGHLHQFHDLFDRLWHLAERTREKAS